MPTLTWLGKDAVVDHHRKVPLRMLRDVPDLAIPGATDAPTHTLIEGDNLHALKALLPRYRGRVKCIYIDPPYNTGNEGWVYNDNVNSPAMRNWLAKEVGRDDLSRHDKWLCMMYPRLVLMRELLSVRSGSIWVSIDDNAVHLLRQLMDEIFGASRFVACNVWQKRYSRENREAIGDVHEYVMVYAMDPEVFKTERNRIPLDEESRSVYKNPNNDPKGLWQSISFTAQGYRPNQMYEIVAPNGNRHKPPPGRCWAMIEPEYKKVSDSNRLYFGSDGNGVPRMIRYLSEVEGLVPWTWWPHEDVGHTDEAKKELTEILGRADLFDTTPKPVRLIERILHIASNPGDLVLDAFAGSGTTGQAVMQLNAASTGPRRECVLVQLGTDQADRPNIAQSITRERLARVSEGYTNAKGERSEGLHQAWRYQRLGESFTNGYGMPRTDLPFTDLAPIVFFHATGQAIPQPAVDRAFLGASAAGVGVYLLYNGDMDDKDARSRNVLTVRMLEKLHPYRGERIVYGAACRVDEGELKRQRVTFRQYPQALAQVAS